MRKRVWYEPNSASICTDVIGHFKGRKRELGGDRVREVKNRTGSVSVGVIRPAESVSWQQGELGFLLPRDWQAGALSFPMMTFQRNVFQILEKGHS